MGGYDILGQLVVDSVAVHDKGTPIGFHNGRYIGCGYPSSLGAYYASGGDIFISLVADHPPDFSTRVGWSCGARQGNWIANTRF